MRTGLSGSVSTPDAPGASDGAPAGKASWRRPRPFSRPQWYPVAGAAVVAALLVGVAMTLLTLSRGPQARPLAHDCGLVTCGARLPAGVLGAAVPSTAVRTTAPARGQRRTRPPTLAPAVHRKVRPVVPIPAPSRVAPSPAPSPDTWTRHHHRHRRHHHHHQDQDG